MIKLIDKIIVINLQSCISTSDKESYKNKRSSIFHFILQTNQIDILIQFQNPTTGELFIRKINLNKLSNDKKSSTKNIYIVDFQYGFVSLPHHLRINNHLSVYICLCVEEGGDYLGKSVHLDFRFNTYFLQLRLTNNCTLILVLRLTKKL